VIAGAGSGKTRTLVYRVARLIEDGLDPSRILLLTFTNKASRRDAARVETLLSVDTRRLMGGTFPLGRQPDPAAVGARLGLTPSFSILDPEDAREMLEAATSDRRIPTLDRRFPKGDVLLDLYSFTVNTGRPFPAGALRARAALLRARDRDRLDLPALPRSQARGNSVDYDDLLLLWKRLLDEGGEASAQLSASYDTSSSTSTRTRTSCRARSSTGWRRRSAT
jgi:DNA helicase-2/ATP-dependent DNA helicase PcrA